MNISIIPIPSLAAAALAAAVSGGAEPAPPFTVSEGPDWVRIDYRKDIIPGSALDFSAFSCDAPAGAHGWLRRVGGHFEFEERPGEPVRFYGANLCYSACWPDREEADRLVARLKATGYNSIRLHHHDNGLTLGGAGPADFNAENLDRFDYLVATAIKAGLYVTTDLYVSRRVKWRDIGFDRDGDVPMAVFKALIAFWEPAFRNWEAYATAFLEHVNPYTGRRYADEPGMPLLVMVNEGCYRINWKEIAELPCVREAWDKWVEAKLAEDPRFAGGADLSAPSLLKWNKEGRFTHTALATFLGEMEVRVFARELSTMRGLGAKALFTSLNHLPHHAPAHRVRQRFYDYFDDHCYVDHPYWPKQSWKLPAGLNNLNPLLDPEFRLPKHAFHRLWGMPATMSEWNFCGPNAWRGMGGLLTGAMAAGQDWSGVWRFAYMHGRDAFRDGAGEPGFFDVAKDPIAMLAERTVVPLYLRGDFRALPQKISLVLDEKAQRPLSAQMPAFFPEWRAEAVWRAQIGVAFPETPEPGAEAFELTAVMDDPVPPLALSDPPQMRIDLAAGTFSVETPLTCGGFATNGTICSGALTARIVRGGPTAVAATSLDGRPLADSARILVTHLTDAQAEGRIFQDETRKRLLDWGRQPILIRDGEVEISLMLDCSQIFNVHKSSLSKNINDKRSGDNALGELGLPIDGNEDLELVDNPAEWRVYALGTDGKREGIVESRLDGGRLSFTARIRGPHGACMAYEVVDEQRRGSVDDGRDIIRGVGLSDASRAVPNPSVRLSVVQDAPGYNSWPMIATIGNKIVCTYGRGLGHSVEGSRGAYARTSLDGGKTWSSEVCIANDPVVCEGVEGVGNDEGGAMLCWMNCRLRRKGHILHDLYRTEDGVSYEKIASPDLSPEPVQITGIFSVPGVGLMSLWFSGLYGNRKDGHAWGTLVSEDNGRTWRQRTIEENLPKAEWPTEISCVPVGGSRLFAIARREGRAPCQFQLTSLDGGKTWRKSLTNITDVRESTPALLFDHDTGLVSNYYYQRGPGLLWRRTARLESVFDEAGAWPDPEPIARGGRIRPHDSGNVTAVACGEFHHLAYYSGNPADTSVLVATVPPAGSR